MRIKYKIILILLCCLGWVRLQAQTVRTISVGQGSSYTDHLSLKEDTKDMDLMVKFVFNENDNTLTVTLISYRTLFVFWDNVHFKPLIKGRKIRPKQLPYVVEANASDKFKVTTKFKASIPKPVREFYFRRWVEYEGLQPAPQEYKMVNDFITQTFDIQNKRNLVTVRLRDVFLMDKIEKKKYNLYEIPLGRDLNLEYQVTIMRNPCFGLDEDIASAKKALESVSTSYSSFAKRIGNGVVTSKETLQVLEDLKSTLLGQFEKKDIQSACPDIQDGWDEYNNYVDSIANLKVTLETGDKSDSVGGMPVGGLKILIAKSRQLDGIVSHWLVCADPVERRDLINQGLNIVKEMDALIGKRTGHTAEQQKAIAIYRAAERYFRNTCKL